MTLDLLFHWEDKYGEDKFPPAAKHSGKVEKSKNRHILHHQMKKVPKIEKLVKELEDELSDVTIDSVWLVKKTKKDVGIKVWHLGMKHTNTIEKTIVMNLGFGISAEEIDDVKTVLTRSHGAAIEKPFYSVPDAWKHHATMKNPNNVNFIHCYLDCPVCSSNAKYTILVGNDKYIHRYLTSTAWYDYEFVDAFIALVQHSYHTLVSSYKSSSVHVKMIRTPHP